MREHLGTLLLIVAAILFLIALALNFLTAKMADEHSRVTYAIITGLILAAAAMFFVSAMTLNATFQYPPEQLDYERMKAFYEGLTECRIQHVRASQ